MSSSDSMASLRRHIYRADEVDFFVGYCYENDGVYVVPFDVASGRTELRFWIMREPIGTNGSERLDHEMHRSKFDLLK